MSFLLQLLSSRAVRPALDSLVMGPPPEEEIEAPVDAVPSPLKALPLHPRPPTQPKPPSHRSRSFRHIKHGTLADRDNKIRALFRKNYHVQVIHLFQLYLCLLHHIAHKSAHQRHVQ